MTVVASKFYKVLVISVDIFESKIIDEKHFPTNESANKFVDSLKDTDYITVVVEV